MAGRTGLVPGDGYLFVYAQDGLLESDCDCGIDIFAHFGLPVFFALLVEDVVLVKIFVVVRSSVLLLLLFVLLLLLRITTTLGFIALCGGFEVVLLCAIAAYDLLVGLHEVWVTLVISANLTWA